MGFAAEHVNLALMQLYENGQATNDMTLLIETVTTLQAILGPPESAQHVPEPAVSWGANENDISLQEEDLVRRRSARDANAAGPSAAPSGSTATDDVLIEL